MWITFTADFMYFPQAFNRHVSFAFKAGMVMFVTRECGARAIERGKGRAMTEAECIIERNKPKERNNARRPA